MMPAKASMMPHLQHIYLDDSSVHQDRIALLQRNDVWASAGIYPDSCITSPCLQCWYISVLLRNMPAI